MFSNQYQDLHEILLYYYVTSKSLHHYRDAIETNKVKDNNYIGFTKKELEDSFNFHLVELEKSTSFSMLSSMEALFRIDYIMRVKNRSKDTLSKEFRGIYKLSGENISLENDILLTWKVVYPSFKGIISDFIGALKYRHWLAHGRYWIPKIGRKYDIDTIFGISDCICSNLPLLK